MSQVDALPARPPGDAPLPDVRVVYREGSGPLTFTGLKWTSLAHSCVYAGLLTAAVAGWATPTLILGWTHGVLWIMMSLACIAAVRLRVVPLRVAVAVAVLGGIGPFFGSYEFVREQRRRAARSQDRHTSDETALEQTLE